MYSILKIISIETFIQMYLIFRNIFLFRFISGKTKLNLIIKFTSAKIRQSFLVPNLYEFIRLFWKVRLSPTSKHLPAGYTKRPDITLVRILLILNALKSIPIKGKERDLGCEM